MQFLLMALLSASPGAAEAGPDLPVCESLQTPFEEPHREELKTLRSRIQSSFGDGRRSYVRGHLHAGLDLRAAAGESVHAICEGRVVGQHLGFPHTTLVVEHRDAKGRKFFSSYKHIAEVAVSEGQLVSAETKLARVFKRSEQAKAGWKRLHLHFEIRKSMDDEGAASWTSMNREELERWAFDPLSFFRAFPRRPPVKEGPKAR